eukprot:m.79708 g.79708  ORF g.79708 m.79708 type:complete len:738 (+) comp12725_c0_seq2:204-2417(+)
MGLFKYAKMVSPLLEDLSTYSRDNVKADVVAGFTVGVLLIPQAMAYAQVANMPPAYGLYSSIFPTMVYALLGGSNTMNLGTIALCGLMLGEVVEEYVDDTSVNVEKTVRLAMALTFLIGSVLMVLRILRFGPFIKAYLSPALISGFQTGAAFHIFVSQLKYVMGVPRPENINGVAHIPRKIFYYFSKAPEWNWAAVLITVISMLVIFLCTAITKGNLRFGCCPGPTAAHGMSLLCGMFYWIPSRFSRAIPLPIPGELIVVLLGESLSYGFDFPDRFNISTVGNVPSDLPPIGDIDWDWVGFFAQHKYFEIVVIALITIALTLSDGKTYAEMFDRDLSLNREIATLGFINMIGPFFSSYVAGAGLSRSALACSVSDGQKITQVYSIITAILVLVMLQFFISLLSKLPQACLGAVVLMAIMGLLKKLKEGRLYWRIGKKSDFLIWCCTLLATIFIDLDWGILVGLLVTIHTVFDRLARAKLTVLGRFPETNIYVDTSLHDDAVEHRGVKIIKLDTALFFGSRERLYDFIKRIIVKNHEEHYEEQKKDTIPLHTIVIDASAVIFLDSSGISKLNSMSRELKNKYNCMTLIACASPMVQKTIIDGGFLQCQTQRPLLFPSIGDAVSAGVGAAIFYVDHPPPRAQSQRFVPRVGSEMDLFGKSNLDIALDGNTEQTTCESVIDDDHEAIPMTENANHLAVPEITVSIAKPSKPSNIGKSASLAAMSTARKNDEGTPLLFKEA